MSEQQAERPTRKRTKRRTKYPIAPREEYDAKWMLLQGALDEAMQAIQKAVSAAETFEAVSYCADRGYSNRICFFVYGLEEVLNGARHFRRRLDAYKERPFWIEERA